jgi:glycosyltransferase involved in cell wall biosynthesis
MPYPDIVLVGYLGHFDVMLARVLFRRSTVVLDHLISAAETATDRGFTAPAMLALLRGLDKRAVRSADLVLVDTEEPRTQTAAFRDPDDVLTVPVCAPDVWFAAGTDAESAREDGDSSSPDGPLRVVFFGLYTPLQGAPVIGAALRLLNASPLDVTMIGHGQDLVATVNAAGAAANVSWPRWMDGVELPDVVARHDVCLGIFGVGPKAQRVVPNKVFQGMAAGCVVVTSDTAPQRRILGDTAIFVPPGDPEALAEALRGLAADRRRVASLRRAAREHARAVMTPRATVEPLVDRLSRHGASGGRTADRIR